MKAKDIADCSMFGIPVLPFIFTVLMIDLTMFMTQQLWVASAQLHGKEWADE